MRYDYRPQESVYPLYNTNPATEIHDYNTGIAYVIDRKVGNCSVIPLINSTFGNVMNVSNNSKNSRTQFFIQMKTPSSLLYMDNTYTYEGKRTIRGLPCDVFISQRTDFSVGGYTGFKSIFELYFLDNDWAEVNNGGDMTSTARDIPVRLDVTTPLSVGYNVTFNMFDYSTDHIDLSVFDIQQCYDYTQQQHFQLSFPGPYSQYLNMTSNVFLRVAVSKLAAVTRASMLRFQRPQLDYDNQNVYLTATLVGLPDYSRTVTPSTGAPPPTLLIAYLTLKNNVYMGRIKFNVRTLATANETHQFVASSIRSDIVGPAGRTNKYKSMQHFTMLIEGMSLTSEIDKQLQGVSMDDCAQACITDISMNCQGFSYGETAALECALTTSHPDQHKLASIKPKIRWSIFARNYIDAYTKSPGSMYRVAANGQKASVSSANDCAKFCAQGTSIACRAFVYCWTDQTCLIYNDRAVGVRQPNTVTTCDLYSSSYMMDFKAVNSGVFTFHNVIKVIKVAVWDCANMCVAEQRSACRGFYFSGKSGTCWLTAATAGSAQVKVSTNDSADFFYAYQRQYFPPSATVARGAVASSTVTPVNTGPQTKRPGTGQYLPPSATVARGALASATVPPVNTGITGPKTTLLGTGPQTKRPGTGQYFPPSATVARGAVASATVPPVNTGNQGSTLRSQQVIYKTKIDKGVVVGVAFAMLIVGLIGGAVGFYFFKRFRKTSDTDDLKVNFSTHEDM